MEYFTLEEDSEVEEFVAEDPSYKRKVFWFDLVEKAIGANCRKELVIQAIIVIVSLTLQVNLLVYCIQEGYVVTFVWTLVLEILLGVVNILVQIFYNSKSKIHQEVDLREHHKHRGSLYMSTLMQGVVIVRYIFIFALISPVYNLFYEWTEVGKSGRDLRRPLIMRTQPQPSISEIQLVETNLRRSLRRNYQTLLEAMLRFIPFALVQVFLYVHYFYYTVRAEDREDLSLGQYGIRAYIILWNMIAVSWICTTYAAVYQNYTKALQFHDLREFGTSMHLTLAPAGIRAGIPLLNNFLSVVFRMYCLGILMSTLHVMTLTFFIPIVYMSFHLIVNIMPTRSRFHFENAQASNEEGISTKVSDIVNRWVNIFCPLNIKIECHFHFTFIFTFLYAIIRIGWIVAEWTNSDPQSERYEHDDFENETIWQFAKNCQQEMPLPLPVPFLNGITEFVFQGLTVITFHCSPRRNIFLTDFGVGILFGIQYMFTLLHLLKSKSQILFESDFPLQIGYKWWVKWLSKDMDVGNMLQMKKTILCMILSDDEVEKLSRHFQNWTSLLNWPPRSPLTSRHRQALEAQMDTLWEKCEQNAKMEILSPSNTRLEHLIERRKTVRNFSEIDIQLTKFLEFVREHYDMDDGTLVVVLHAVTNFDKAVEQSNSLRLSHINLILA